MNTPRWYADMPELDEPVPPYLAMLQARTDAILAELHAANAGAVLWEDRDLTAEALEAIGDEAAGLVVDEGLIAAWLDSASREFDVDPEGAY